MSLTYMRLNTKAIESTYTAVNLHRLFRVIDKKRYAKLLKPSVLVYAGMLPRIYPPVLFLSFI